MPPATLVSVEEYLRTTSDPDCEYVDGEILERPMGERGHSTVQAMLIAYFMHRRRELKIRVQPEFRLQTGISRFRVPDVLVEDANTDTERILRTPPLLCVEILSPEDTHSRIQVKVQEYLDFGVPCVWIIDPSTEQAWIHTRSANGDCLSHAVNDGVLTTPDSRLTIPLAELFAE